MMNIIRLADSMAEYFFEEGVRARDVAPSDWLWIASLPVAGVVAWAMILL